jgi:putative exosortase-associated protein (TIGR04073 family)
MRKIATLMTAIVAIAFLTGCDGPTRKLGRGLNNFSEPFRLGELQRSIEQTGLWEGQHNAYTTGILRGLNRTLARTAIGFSEIVTFPIPTPDYDPYFFPDKWFQDPFRKVEIDGFTEELAYPDNYRPGKHHDPIFATDTSVGFAGGELIPFIPGSRFRVFER